MVELDPISPQSITLTPLAKVLGLVAEVQTDITPRAQRKLFSHAAQRVAEIKAGNVSNPRLNAYLDTPVVALEKLPTERELDAMRRRVNNNELICRFIATNEKLRQIQKEGAVFRGHKPTLDEIVSQTIQYDMAKKYKITFPIWMETRVCPLGYDEETGIWVGAVDSELIKCGIRQPQD